MPRITPLHFNADAQAAELAIGPSILSTPPALKPMLALPKNASLQAGVTEEELSQAQRTAQGWTAEAAARQHLQVLLEGQGSERLAEVTSPNRPEAVPDLKLERNDPMPLMNTQSVTFRQTAYSLPIFGTRTVVELDPVTRKLSAVDGMVSDVPDIPAIPTLAIPEVLDKLARHLGKAAKDLAVQEPPPLCFYPQRKKNGGAADGGGISQDIDWKLAYHFSKIPAVPPEQQQVTQAVSQEASCGCCGPAASPFGPTPYDYLVDANDGSLLLYFPSGGFLDIPVACTGTDVNQDPVTFDALQLNPTTFELTDPIRSIQTLDASFADIALNAQTGTRITHTTTDFPPQYAAAVTAHALSTRVYDFFKNELSRHSIDNRGMKLVSVVNCYNSSNGHTHPLWPNAMWYQGRMWYGSLPNGAVGGDPVSTARFVDIMAHELAHGVTQTTSDLIYSGESGALNESFSDIFGIMIKNWPDGQPNPISGWAWEVGVGWQGSGKPLRSLEDPTLGGTPIYPLGLGQPAHMRDYYTGPGDNYGVHVNSGIHNHAFYRVMKSEDNGNPVFTPRDAAMLYYVTLTRLTPMSGFSDCRRTLLNVTTQRFKGTPQKQLLMLDAIRKAYDEVGIL